MINGVAQVTDPLNHTTKTTYDNRDRKQTVTQGYLSGLDEVTTYTYDPANNVTRIDKPAGFWETKTYDGLNRVLVDTVPQTGGGTPVNLPTTFTYNPSGTMRNQKGVSPHF